MVFVATFQFTFADAKVLVQGLRPLRPSDIAPLIGQEKSHDAYDGFRKLVSEILNETPLRSIQVDSELNFIFVTVRLLDDECIAMQKYFRSMSAAQLESSSLSQMSVKKFLRLKDELLNRLQKASTIIDNPYQSFES